MKGSLPWPCMSHSIFVRESVSSRLFSQHDMFLLVCWLPDATETMVLFWRLIPYWGPGQQGCQRAERGTWAPQSQACCTSICLIHPPWPPLRADTVHIRNALILLTVFNSKGSSNTKTGMQEVKLRSYPGQLLWLCSRDQPAKTSLAGVCGKKKLMYMSHFTPLLQSKSWNNKKHEKSKAPFSFWHSCKTWSVQ